MTTLTVNSMKNTAIYQFGFVWEGFVEQPDDAIEVIRAMVAQLLVAGQQLAVAADRTHRFRVFFAPAVLIKDPGINMKLYGGHRMC